MNILIHFFTWLYMKYADFILCFHQILKQLDCDYRTDVYLGVTGFLTAIVIFVAEFVSNDQKSKLDKKVLIEKTDILPNITFMIFNMSLLWLGRVLDNQAYYSFQICINCCLIVSIFQTLKMFYTIIELTLRDDYLAVERDKYIKKKLVTYNEQKEKRKRERKKFRDEVKEKFKNNSLIKFKDYSYDSDGYSPIITTKEGIVTKIDITKIEELLSKIDKSVKEKRKNINDAVKIEENSINQQEIQKNKIDKEKIKQEENEDKKEIIYFSILEGDYIFEKKIMFYIKNEHVEYAESILSNFKIEKDETHLSEDVENIIGEIIEKIRNNDYYQQISKEIKNFLEEIFSNDLNYVEEIFFDQLSKLINEFTAHKKTEKLRNIYELLVDLCCLSVDARNINCLEKYCNLLFLLVDYELNLENCDAQKIAYNFTKSLNSCIYRTWNFEKRTQFYDLILSKKLKLIKKLLRKQEIDAIITSLNVSAINKTSLLEEDKIINEEETLIFQFVVGILGAMIYEYEQIKSKNFYKIKELLDKIYEKFRFNEYYDYSISKIIIQFRNIEYEENMIGQTHDGFMFGDEEEHLYEPFWFGKERSKKYALMGLLYLYEGYSYNPNDFDQIIKDDIHWCKEFERILEENTYNDLFKQFPYYTDDKTRIKDVLNKIKDIAIEKEELYIINTELDPGKVSEFKNIIFENVKKKDELLLLFPEKKLKNSNEKADICIRLENELLPREFFFKEVGGHTMLAENFVDTIKNTRTDGIVRYLEKNAKKLSDINEILNKFEDLKDVIILSNYRDYRTIFNRNNLYTFNNIEIPVTRFRIKNTIVLNKNSFPILQYMKFDEEITKNGEVNENTYIEISDFSKDEELVNKNIENVNDMDVADNGDEEKKQYLRKHCLLKIWHAIKLVECEEKNIFVLFRLQ